MSGETVRSLVNMYHESLMIKRCINLRFTLVFWSLCFVINADIHCESKKGCHPNHGYNFVNSWCICKILSLLQRAVNFQQN